MHATTPEFCDFSLTSQIICCPENSDNEINLNERPRHINSVTETHRTTSLPSLDTLLRDTGLNTNYRGSTTTSRSNNKITRVSNQNNYHNVNRNTDSYGFYTEATRKTTRKPVVSNYEPTSGTHRNGRTTSASADDLFDEAYAGQPTIRPDRPKRREGPRISMQSKKARQQMSSK